MPEPSDAAGRDVPLLEARNISKYFGAITALDKVNFRLSRGEVLGVVGDNGAGKSTLMKILSGLYAPSEGEIVFDGRPVRFASPRDARAAGIEMVYSEGHDRYYSWDELSDLDPEDTATLGIVWATTTQQIGFDAHNLIENACEELHEDAMDNIGKAEQAELQAALDAWVEKHGKYTTTYYPDYKRVIILSEPAVVPEGGGAG